MSVCVFEIVLLWVDMDLIYKSGDLCVMLFDVFIVEMFKCFEIVMMEVVVEVV